MPRDPGTRRKGRLHAGLVPFRRGGVLLAFVRIHHDAQHARAQAVGALGVFEEGFEAVERRRVARRRCSRRNEK